VRDHGDVNGFDYVGSLTYRKSGFGLELESAGFGDGMIRERASGQEVNREGRLTRLKPIELVVPDVGMGRGVLNNLNRLSQTIKKGQAPKSIIRLDKGKNYKELPHVHFDNGSALKINGVWKHGYKELTNKEIKFLKRYEWILPDK